MEKMCIHVEKTPDSSWGCDFRFDSQEKEKHCLNAYCVLSSFRSMHLRDSWCLLYVVGNQSTRPE